MKYAKPIDNLYRTPTNNGSKGQKVSTNFSPLHNKLTFIGKLIQRNLGRRGLTLAMKLERLISKNKYADQRI